MSTLTINVMGTPIPQGSKTANAKGHGVRDANAKALKPWRADITRAASEAALHYRDPDDPNVDMWHPVMGPAELVATFHQPRPASHYGTGRNADRLKPTAPTWCAVKPDADKLLRAICDGLTDAGVIVDDSRIVRIVVEHRYANGHPGARLQLTPIERNPEP